MTGTEGRIGKKDHRDEISPKSMKVSQVLKPRSRGGAPLPPNGVNDW